MVKDHPGASLEINPGVYFQNRITGDAFDIPWKLFVLFLVKKDKIFGVIGLGGALYQYRLVAPGGGLIWLFSDNLRLERVFPAGAGLTTSMTIGNFASPQSGSDQKFPHRRCVYAAA